MFPGNTRKRSFESLKEAHGDKQKLQAVADDMNERRYRKAAHTIERLVPGL